MIDPFSPERAPVGRFADRVVAWQRVHGRHTLPWQNTHDPYRIWLSEIMLQQTQVSAVIPYYARFLARCPDVASLAAAPADDVMALWAGLGYYSRARNLHRAAQTIVAEWGGQFPPTAAEIATLSGIGRSTAAAVAAFAWGERAAILDGNVKRVFARHFGIEGDPATSAVSARMWAQAEAELPGSPEAHDPEAMRAYTQGLMDLGATLCTRGSPDCGRCPVRGTCVALREARQHLLPTPKVRKAVPERTVGMLLVVSDAGVLLERRPSPGIWGGLWSLPEFGDAAMVGRDEPAQAAAACAALGLTVVAQEALAPFAHAFTHYRLLARPWQVAVRAAVGSVAPGAQRAWVAVADLDAVALPAPIGKLLRQRFGQGRGDNLSLGL